MKPTLICAVLFASAFTFGCASEPIDPYGLSLPVHETWAAPENTTLASADWKDAGDDSPEQTLETFLWAGKMGNSSRQNDVTCQRMGYKKEYDESKEKPREADADVFMDDDFNFYSAKEVEEQTAALTNEERLKIYEHWLRPYIRGPLTTRSIGTAESPIPYGVQPRTASSAGPHTQGEIVASFNGYDPDLFHPKPMLDVTILARKVISHTEVELDVREHYSAESSQASMYFYVPCDFQLINGTSWKLIEEQGFHTADGDVLTAHIPPTAGELAHYPPGRPVQSF